MVYVSKGENTALYCTDIAICIVLGTCVVKKMKIHYIKFSPYNVIID